MSEIRQKNKVLKIVGNNEHKVLKYISFGIITTALILGISEIALGATFNPDKGFTALSGAVDSAIDKHWWKVLIGSGGAGMIIGDGDLLTRGKLAGKGITACGLVMVIAKAAFS
jgi:hypothetical protein